MSKEEKYEQIEQFLEGKLTGEALQAFEQKMADNPLFAAEVKLHKGIEESFVDQDLIALSQTVQAVLHQKKQASAGSGRIVVFRRLLQIVAGLALLIAAYFVIQNYSQPDTPQELAAKYFAPEEQFDHDAAQTSRNGEADDSTAEIKPLSQSIDKVWQEIEVFYNEKKYGQALAKLQEIQTLDPTFTTQSPSEFYYFEGLFLMFEKKPDLALLAFEKIEMTYTEKATWYSALAYLQKGDTTLAKKELEKILAKKTHSFKKEAKALMEQL